MIHQLWRVLALSMNLDHFNTMLALYRLDHLSSILALYRLDLSHAVHTRTDSDQSRHHQPCPQRLPAKIQATT
jgi:hypothetical protein